MQLPEMDKNNPLLNNRFLAVHKKVICGEMHRMLCEHSQDKIVLRHDFRGMLGKVCHVPRSLQQSFILDMERYGLVKQHGKRKVELL